MATAPVATATPMKGNNDELIAPKVEHDRKMTDVPSLVVFAGFMIFNWILGIMAIGKSRIGDVSLSTSDENMFDYIAEKPGPTVGGFAIALVLSGVWLYCLERFTRATVWFTIAVDVVLTCVVGVWMMQNGANEAGGVCLVAAALLAIASFIWRAKVETAAQLMSLATSCFKKFPSLLLATIVLNLLLFAFAGIQVIFYIYGAVPKAGEDNQVGLTMVVTTIGFYWTLGFFKAVRMFMCAYTAGVWYFEDPAAAGAIKHPVSGSLKLAFTSHFGTMALGGALFAIVDWLKSQVNKGTKSCNPVILAVACFIKHCCLAFIDVIGKFALVGAAFSGQPLWTSGRRAFRTMKGKFAGGFVTDRVSNLVLSSGAFFLSFAIGLIVAELQGLNTQMGIAGLLTYGILLYKPFFCLLFSVLLGVLIGGLPADFTAALIAMFVGSICHILLKFVAESIANLTDALFLAYASDSAFARSSQTEIARNFASQVGKIAGDQMLSDNPAPSEGGGIAVPVAYAPPSVAGNGVEKV